MTPLFKLISLTALMMSSLLAQAQDQPAGSITGKLIDENGQPVEFAGVSVHTTGDSTLIKGTVSDSAGHFLLDEIPYGDYLLMASFVGYRKTFAGPVTLSAKKHSVDIGKLTLSADKNMLSEVTVVGKKPLIEQKIDRTVLNIENSILAEGNTALEVLEKAPGVVVDNDGNITLRGKSGVMVMIDGKPTYLSQQELTSMLRSMSSSSIAQVEIITNPSAKYDAAGNSGIINIKIKKNQLAGINGEVNASYGQGRRYRGNTGMNLNYRNNGTNLFGSYSYGDRKRISDLFLRRNFFNGPGQTDIDRRFLQDSEMTMPSNSHTFKAGADFQLDDKNKLGVQLNGNTGRWESVNPSVTRIVNPDGSDRSNSLSDNQVNEHWTNMTYNLNYQLELDTTGREFTADFDHSRSNFGSDQDFYTDFYDNNGNSSIPPSVRRGDLPSLTRIYTGKADYVHPFGEGAKLEAGWKSSFVTTDNDVKYDTLQGDTWVRDASTTNHFRYKENINAGYVNFNKEFGSVSLQVGLRGEQTISEGQQLTTDSVVKRNYFQLFPSIFVGKKLGDKHQLRLSYSRRIDRPSYSNLNPFRFYIDPYTYAEGNPYLQPELTHSIELSHVFKEKFTTTLNFSHTNDVMTQLTQQIDSTNTTFISRENLSTRNNYGLSITAPVEITDWWTSNNFFNLYYNQFKGTHLDEDVDMGMASFQFNSQNSFTLKNGFSFELSGRYQSESVWGIIRIKPMYQVSAGVQKKVLDGKGTIKLNVNDIFATQRFRGDIRYQNMDIHIREDWDNRYATLSFSYRFGKQDIKSNGKRKTSSEDEQSRMRGSGN